MIVLIKAEISTGQSDLTSDHFAVLCESQRSPYTKQSFCRGNFDGKIHSNRAVSLYLLAIEKSEGKFNKHFE